MNTIKITYFVVSKENKKLYYFMQLLNYLFFLKKKFASIEKMLYLCNRN